MNVGWDLDAASERMLQRTMERYAREMNKTAAYTVTRTLQNIAGWAAHETIKANRQKLAAQLNASYRPARAITSRSPVTPTTLAKARYAANLRRKGRPIPPEPMFSQKAQAMVKAILRSVAFMKAGWLPAFRALKAKQKEVTEAEAFGDRKEPGYGDVTPTHAVSGGFEGEIANQSVNRLDSGSWPALERHAGQGLDRAILLKIKDMEDYLDRQMDKHNKAFNDGH